MDYEGGHPDHDCLALIVNEISVKNKLKTFLPGVDKVVAKKKSKMWIIDTITNPATNFLKVGFM